MTSRSAMAAEGVTDALAEAIGSGEYDFIVANDANPDMVGHTGVWSATLEALEVIDGRLARVVEAIGTIEAGLTRVAPERSWLSRRTTATPTTCSTRQGRPVTAHSLNPLFVLIGRSVAGRRLVDGVLADVAPTVLELAGLPAWAGMTGRSLLAGGGGRPPLL